MHDYQAPADLLRDRVILVTGASQGLGRAAALAYARHGACVILLGRNISKLEKVYDDIVAAGGPKPAIFPMDLAQATDADYAAMADAIGYQLTRLDGILHCAAAFEGLAPQHLETVDAWLRLFRVNTAAPAAITRACAPLLQASDLGTVILVGETHGHAPAAYWGGFAISKAALEAYFTIQADEWSAAGPRIHLLIPGPINTPQRMKTHPGEAKGNLPQVEDLVPTLLYLIGPEGVEARGRIIMPMA